MFEGEISGMDWLVSALSSLFISNRGQIVQCESKHFKVHSSAAGESLPSQGECQWEEMLCERRLVSVERFSDSLSGLAAF